MSVRSQKMIVAMTALSLVLGSMADVAFAATHHHKLKPPKVKHEAVAKCGVACADPALTQLLNEQQADVNQPQKIMVMDPFGGGPLMGPNGPVMTTNPNYAAAQAQLAVINPQIAALENNDTNYVAYQQFNALVTQVNANTDAISNLSSATLADESDLQGELDDTRRDIFGTSSETTIENTYGKTTPLAAQVNANATNVAALNTELFGANGTPTNPIATSLIGSLNTSVSSLNAGVIALNTTIFGQATTPSMLPLTAGYSLVNMVTQNYVDNLTMMSSLYGSGSYIDKTGAVQDSNGGGLMSTFQSIDAINQTLYGSQFGSAANLSSGSLVGQVSGIATQQAANMASIASLNTGMFGTNITSTAIAAQIAKEPNGLITQQVANVAAIQANATNIGSLNQTIFGVANPTAASIAAQIKANPNGLAAQQAINMAAIASDAVANAKYNAAINNLQKQQTLNIAGIQQNASNISWDQNKLAALQSQQGTDITSINNLQRLQTGLLNNMYGSGNSPGILALIYGGQYQGSSVGVGLLQQVQTNTAQQATDMANIAANTAQIATVATGVQNQIDKINSNVKINSKSINANLQHIKSVAHQVRTDATLINKNALSNKMNAQSITAAYKRIDANAKLLNTYHQNLNSTIQLVHNNGKNIAANLSLIHKNLGLINNNAKAIQDSDENIADNAKNIHALGLETQSNANNVIRVANNELRNMRATKALAGTVQMNTASGEINTQLAQALENQNLTDEANIQQLNADIFDNAQALGNVSIVTADGDSLASRTANLATVAQLLAAAQYHNALAKKSINLDTQEVHARLQALNTALIKVRDTGVHDQAFLNKVNAAISKNQKAAKIADALGTVIEKQRVRLHMQGQSNEAVIAAVKAQAKKVIAQRSQLVKQKQVLLKKLQTAKMNLRTANKYAKVAHENAKRAATAKIRTDYNAIHDKNPQDSRNAVRMQSSEDAMKTSYGLD